MKILTLNAHSLSEDNYPQILADFVLAISKEQPEIIALQEANQTFSQTAVTEEIIGYVPCGDYILRKDNHVYNAARLIEKHGVRYYWTWLPIKHSYGKFDEGVALLSLSPILETRTALISTTHDYNNWRTRGLLGIRTEAAPDQWFFSVHFGWWDDPEEPFQPQWQRTNDFLKELGTVWLMGDFNSPAQVRGEGYDLVESSHWFDTYILAQNKDEGITVGKVIDGWHDKIPQNTSGMRIDQIWCNKKVPVTDSRVIFNGENYPVVSDHYGVIVTL